MKSKKVSRLTGLRFKLRPRVYSWDRLTINSRLPVSGLIEILPIEELLEHCKPNRYGNIIFEASNTGKHSGYQSKIDAVACTDKFVEILQRYDIGKLTHMQVAEDTFFKNDTDLEQYIEWHKHWVKRNWSKKGFMYEGTKYQGKEAGKASLSYDRGYKRDSKITGDSCFHHEFEFNTWATISRVLKISHLSELGRCADVYWMLEKRYMKSPRLRDVFNF